jgi:pimeloyl-ACP methyl ester carboxylesterase
MGRTAARLAGALLIAASIAACGTGTTQPTPAVTAEAAPSTAVDTTYVADVDVGGRTMHIVCLGPTETGRPTVVFESGLGGEFDTWGQVLTELSATDRGCSYDRAGVGMSQNATAPRTTADQVEDLRTLLTTAGVEPPFVLVGYSLGGWNVLVHADRHPDDVAGAVMVDVRPPAASARFLAELPPESAGEPDLLHQYREGYTAWESDATRNPEGLLLADSALEADTAVGLGDRPLIVLAGADTTDGEGSDLDAPLPATFDAIWWELQDALARESTIGRLERVNDTGHDMPYERPDAILEAIQEVLATTGG